MIKFDDYIFVFNAMAYFDANDKYPDGFIEPLLTGGRESFDTICWFLSELSEQGELTKRQYGYDEGKYLTVEDCKTLLSPKQLTTARDLILATIAKGMNTDNDDEEVDEVLLELQKKTTRTN